MLHPYQSLFFPYLRHNLAFRHITYRLLISSDLLNIYIHAHIRAFRDVFVDGSVHTGFGLGHALNVPKC